LLAAHFEIHSPLEGHTPPEPPELKRTDSETPHKHTTPHPTTTSESLKLKRAHPKTPHIHTTLHPTTPPKSPELQIAEPENTERVQGGFESEPESALESERTVGSGFEGAWVVGQAQDEHLRLGRAPISNITPSPPDSPRSEGSVVA